MEYTCASGAKLGITMSDFETAHALRKAVIKLTETLQAKTKEEAETELSLKIMTSEEVEKSLFKCFGRCVYEGFKLNKGLFDDPNLGEQLRGDYDEICSQVIKVNCGPFTKASSISEKKPETLTNTPQ
jgi:hypothetical protein